MATTGPDKITGTTGDDSLFGDAGNDSLSGLAGNDTLDGGTGNDILNGGFGDDTYYIDSTLDKVVEAVTAGHDIVYASVSYTLASNVEDLVLSGSASINAAGNSLANTLTGNAGDNTLNGGAGADLLIGGDGDDVYFLDNTGDAVTEAGGEGNDTVVISYTNKSVLAVSIDLGTSFANVENARLTGTGLFDLTGNGGDNSLTGNASVNTLTGNGGNDTLDGGGGADRMIGGAGNDVYTVDNAGDSISDSGGTDTILDKMASGIFVLGSGFENITLLGKAALGATGNAGVNILTGNAGANVLDGAAGADTMTGGAGADTYIVDNSGDKVVETTAGPAGGVDLVKASASFTLGENLENLTLTGNGSISGTGNALANVITGNSGDNILSGGGGADKMAGGLGNDSYLVELVNARGQLKFEDSVSEASGGGIDTLVLHAGSIGFQGPHTLTLAANFENLDAALTGSNLLNLTGNAVDNIIVGNAAGNTMTGLAGNDTLDGGDGSDVIFGGLGDDAVHVDLSSSVFVDGIRQELDVLDGGDGNDTLVLHLTNAQSHDVGLLAAIADLETAIAGGNSAPFTSAELGLKVTGFEAVSVTTLSSSLFVGGDDDVDFNALSAHTFSQVAYHQSFGGDDVVYLPSAVSAATLGYDETSLFLADAGNDTIIGRDLNDTIDGGTGDDTLDGGTGANTLVGGTGDDVLAGGADNDTYNFAEGDGHDTVTDSGGRDVIHFDASVSISSVGYEQAGSDLVVHYGQSGDDVTVTGFFSGAANQVELVTFSDGDAHNVAYIMETFDAGFSAFAAHSRVAVAAEFAYAPLSFETGTSGDDLLTGTSDNDYIAGLEGNDTIFGLGGDDYLVGGNGVENFFSGVDTLDGGDGNDVLSAVGLYNGVTLLGGNGDDILIQGTGNQYLAGGAGNDTYVMTNGGGSGIENPGEGIDTVLTSGGGDLLPDFENMILTGSDAIDGGGNASDNMIAGNSGTNTLTGMDGNDTLDGGEGGDAVFGGNGDDIVTVDLTHSYFANGQRLDFDVADGGSGNDTLLLHLSYAEGQDADITDEVSALVAAIGGGNATPFTSAILGISVTAFEYISVTVDDSAAPLFSNTGETVDFNSGTALGSDINTYFDALGGDDVVNLPTAAQAAILGYSDAIVFRGGDGNDTITGADMNDTIDGGRGDDTIDGGAGADKLSGGGGNDVFIVDDASDVVTGGSGTDEIRSSVAWSLASHPEIENLTLAGSNAVDGTGNDGSNTIIGNDGNNSLAGGFGDDVISAAGGDDHVLVDMVFNVFSGGVRQEFDTLDGGAGTDTLTIRIVTTDAADPGVSADLAALQAAIDGGNTTYFTSTSLGLKVIGFETLDVVTVLPPLFSDGSETVNFNTIAAGSYDVATFHDALKGDDVVQLPSAANATSLGYDGSVQFAGNAGNDVITGDDMNDTISGGTGNDTIDGGAGDDIIDGGAGNDTLTGGAGNDTFFVDSTSDHITDGNASDTIMSSVSWSLSSNSTGVTHLVLTGSAVINGSGTNGADYLKANAADGSQLFGGGGNDTLEDGGGVCYMQGGSGDDVYIIHNAGDEITEQSGQGNDMAYSDISYTVNGVETLILTGTNAIDGAAYVFSSAITIIGNVAANTLTGGIGSDSLDGGDGADVLIGNGGGDTFLFHAATAFNATDSIQGFILPQGDKIDISDLMTGYNPATMSLSDWVEKTASGSDVILSVDRDGAGSAFSFTPVATLVDATNYTPLPSLDQMVANGSLIID